jgi:hypothetical protein
VRQVVRGIYLDSGLVDDLPTRAEAVARILPQGAAISRRTAAWLFGVDVRAPSELTTAMPVECTVPLGTEPLRRPGVRCFVAMLGPDVHERFGVPCTTAVRTAVDLLRWEPPHLGLGAADALAKRGAVGVEELVAAVERWRHHRGVDKARRLAHLVEPLTESFGESWLRLRIVDAGFPRPSVQIEVCDRFGRIVYRIDLGWPERGIGVEYDGEEYHDAPEHRRHDLERRRRLEEAFGWTVVGVGRAEVLGRSLALERGIGELLGLEPKIRVRAW